MPAKAKELKIRVSDLSHREDFGCGIARMELSKIKEMEADEGDIIEIKSGKSVACVVLACEDCKDVIKIDSLTRRNCEANLGEMATIKKIKAKEAETVTIALARKGLNIHLSGHEIQKSLMLRPVKAGDIILPNPLPGRGEFQEIMNKDISRALLSTTLEERFVVVSTNPEGIVRVVDQTEVYISSETVSAVKELEEPFNSRVINVKKCPELKNFIEVKSLDDIKKLINSQVIVNRYEDDKFVLYFGSNYFLRILKSV